VGVSSSPHKNSIILKWVEAPKKKKKFNRAREVHSITQKLSFIQTLDSRRRKFSGPQVDLYCCKYTANSRLRSQVVTRPKPTAPKPRDKSAIRDEEHFGIPMEPDEHRLVFKNTAYVIAWLRDRFCGMVVYNSSISYLCVQCHFHYTVFVNEESTTSLVQF